MDDAAMLEALKVDLGISTDAYNNRLAQYITSAQAAIETEGTTIDTDDLPDANLVVMYAAWMWRRRDTGEGMPRMLRYKLNNRLFSEKVADNG